MKILNLYAGIGGNRKKWGNKHKITSVEFDKEIAKVYKDNFPNDKMIVGDAKEYLLKHYNEFDIIWASPPCQTHSIVRQNAWVKSKRKPPIFINLELYQIIIFLEHNFEGKWIVENVKPYYKPLINPQIVARHCFWSNAKLTDKVFKPIGMGRVNEMDLLRKALGFDLSGYKIKNKRQVLRNCVKPKLGKHILKCLTKDLKNVLKS